MCYLANIKEWLVSHSGYLYIKHSVIWSFFLLYYIKMYCIFKLQFCFLVLPMQCFIVIMLFSHFTQCIVHDSMYFKIYSMWKEQVFYLDLQVGCCEFSHIIYALRHWLKSFNQQENLLFHSLLYKCFQSTQDSVNTKSENKNTG